MATASAPSENLLQKISLDSKDKTENSQSTKKAIVDSGNVSNGQIQLSNRSMEPLFPIMDPTMWYANGYALYSYGEYYGTSNELDDYSKYLKPDGVEMPHEICGGYGYYSPTGPPIPILWHDGQLYGVHYYQYPTSYFQPPATSTNYDISTIAPVDQPISSIETTNEKAIGIANGSGIRGNKGSTIVKPTYHNSSYMSSSYNANSSDGRGVYSGGVPAFGYVYDISQSSIPWVDGSFYTNANTRLQSSASITQYISSGNGLTMSKNWNARPHPRPMLRPLSSLNTRNDYMSNMYSNKFYNENGISYGSGFYEFNVYDSQTTENGWFSNNKYGPRRRYGFVNYKNGSMDGLNEVSRGPRAKIFKDKNGDAPAALTMKKLDNLVTGTNGSDNDNPNVDKDDEQYNKADFPETYIDAKFFVIKSYSEDDVHKSIKYNVWSSTQNGNKKLHAVYNEAHQNSSNYPIFLLFSVNASGQFVGVAEMLGPVDFEKNLEYWQKDKWVGCFPVKWHMVKDVPNCVLKHITLENNGNKPVTNSRDTQEIKLEQGIQLLKIFKSYSSDKSILDDFDFYEDRQKKILDKKAKQQLIHKQLWEGKLIGDITKRGSNVEASNQKLIDVHSNSTKNSTPTIFTNVDAKVLKNIEIVEAQEVPVITKKLVSNVIANSC